MRLIPQYGSTRSGQWQNSTWSRLQPCQNQQHQRNTECRRCGSNHGINQFCKALTRICYICRQYGHYANYCHETGSDSVKQHKKASGFRNRNYLYSQFSQHKGSTYRDTKHHGNVDILKTSVCSLMPFNEIDNLELVKLMPINSSLCGKQYSTKTDKDVDYVNSNNLQEKMTQLIQENKTLLNSVTVLEKIYLAAKQDLENLASRQSDEILNIVERNGKDITEYRQKEFSCLKCGSTVHHIVCQAIANKCSLCEQVGHYAVFCPQIEAA